MASFIVMPELTPVGCTLLMRKDSGASVIASCLMRATRQSPCQRVR